MRVVQRVLLILLLAVFVTAGWIWLVHRPSGIEKAVQSASAAGFIPNARSYAYNGEVECRVEQAEGFLGQDLYVCKLGLEGFDAQGGQYVYAAMVDGSLYTHKTNPNLIP